jgi:CRP-like cAMP-binding protein
VADNKLADTLAKFTPVNALNPDNLMDLAQKASVKELQAGYTLFKSGDRDKRHVFLVKGSVELASERGVHKTVYGGTPDASHALAHAQPRNFTAKATSDVVCIRKRPKNRAVATG